MKQFKTLLAQLLVISSLMLPWATSEALEISTQSGVTTEPGNSKSTATVQTFSRAGVITRLGYDKFTIGDRDFRFAPGAKLHSNDSKRSRFSDFKVGDEIYFKGKVLDGVNYVDIIYYETPESS
jgi:hypothetical protein